MQAANVHVVLVAFEILRKPRDVDALIPAGNLDLKIWQKQVSDAIKGQAGRSTLNMNVLLKNRQCTDDI